MPPPGEGQFIPFGKHIPKMPGVNYYVATGVQECNQCQEIIKSGSVHGRNWYGLCGGVEEEYLPMCLAQQKVLQACPEHINDWCYQDYGGSQRLRSPCPMYLICHYCLGMNPLHCATSMVVGEREKWDA